MWLGFFTTRSAGTATEIKNGQDPKTDPRGVILAGWERWAKGGWGALLELV